MSEVARRGPLAELGLRLRWLREDRYRQRELGMMAILLGLVAYLAPSVTYRYPTFFGALIALFVLVFMIENQEKTLYLLLFFSSVYVVLKATLLGWSGLAFLFKEGFLALLVGFWVFHLVLREERLRPTPLNGPVLLLAGWLVLECFNPNTSGIFLIIDDLRFWLGPLCIFFLTVHLVDSRAKVERALKVVFAYAVIETVYGVAQQAMPGDLLVRLGADPESYFYFYHGSIRSFSTMGTAGFAVFASMFPPIAFFYMSQQRDMLRRWLLLGTGFLFVLGVVFTYVRTGWVAVSLAMLAYAIATRRGQIVGIVVVVAFVLVSFSSGFMRTKVEGIIHYDEDQSIQTRISIFENVWKGVAFRVFGYGMGTFAHNRFGYAMSDRPAFGSSTENWYLMTSLELGWVGVGILLWIWLKAYRIGWKGFRGGLGNRRYREMAIAILASLFAIDVARMGGPSGYYPPDSWHYWFFIGLLMALPRADQELSAELAASSADGASSVLVAAAAPAAPAAAAGTLVS